MKVAFFILFLSLFLFVRSQIDCGGKANSNPFITTPPKFVREVTNGKLYQVDSIEPPLLVAHLWGTPYEMGKAHGELLKKEINELIPEVYDWIYEQIDPYLADLPEFLRKIIEEEGIAAALDATYYMTEPYTPKHFIEEMQGLAEGSGLSYLQVQQVHMIPELIKAACTMVGAWGKAVENTTQTLVQLRALDWSTSGPFQQYPTVFVFHPNEGDGHDFSILAWTGFVGAMTGFSSTPIGVCEKVWDSYKGSSTRIGEPWTWVLRDILQYDTTISSALSRIINADRTCSIFVGLGDGEEFRAVEYSYEEVNVFNDMNYPLYDNHPRYEGLVYIDKHDQPSQHKCLPSLVKKYYGSFDPAVYIRDIVASVQTGDMHAAVYDFSQNTIYVSNASPVNATTKEVIPAYDRPFVKLDMTALFSEHPPSKN